MIKFKSEEYVKALLKIQPAAYPYPPQYVGKLHIKSKNGKINIVDMWQGDCIDTNKGYDNITFYPDPDYFSDTTPQIYYHATYVSYLDRLNLSFMDKLRIMQIE